VHDLETLIGKSNLITTKNEKEVHMHAKSAIQQKESTVYYSKELPLLQL
jgi:hypothetical protein